ncbi:MAG: hypothetical protein PHO42_04495 [Candidatus Omnitrophica bacterium]|nr:hypothetical protein [Candidatus Omnitrophota bacterium]
MISQTGRRKTIPDQGWANSFTLIELLIVSVIILALAAFSTPLFRRSFTDLELKETVSNISKFITYAQHRAIIDKRIYKIDFDFEKNTYRLYGQTGEGDQAQFKSPQDRFGRLFYIPSSITIDGKFNEIFFYPDGHSDNGNAQQPEQIELTLKDRNEKTLTVTTTGILGNVVVKNDREF